MQPVRWALPSLIAAVGSRDVARLAPQLAAPAASRLRPVGAGGAADTAARSDHADHADHADRSARSDRD